MDKNSLPREEGATLEDASHHNTQYKVITTKTLYRNLILLSVSFLLLFVAYNGLGYLQSSLHREGGMGVVTQGILYATSSLSNLLLPRYFTDLLS